MEVVPTVKVEEPEVLTDCGLKLVLTPAGRALLTLKVTFPVNAPEGVAVIV